MSSQNPITTSEDAACIPQSELDAVCLPLLSVKDTKLLDIHIDDKELKPNYYDAGIVSIGGLIEIPKHPMIYESKRANGMSALYWDDMGDMDVILGERKDEVKSGNMDTLNALYAQPDKGKLPAHAGMMMHVTSGRADYETIKETKPNPRCQKCHIEMNKLKVFMGNIKDSELWGCAKCKIQVRVSTL